MIHAFFHATWLQNKLEEFGSHMKKPLVLGKCSCIPNGNMATSGSVTFLPPANPLQVSALSRRGRNKNIFKRSGSQFSSPVTGRTTHSTIPNIRGLGMERSNYFFQKLKIFPEGESHRAWFAYASEKDSRSLDKASNLGGGGSVVQGCRPWPVFVLGIDLLRDLRQLN